MKLSDIIQAATGQGQGGVWKTLLELLCEQLA